MKIKVLPILIFSSLFLQSCGGGETKIKSTRGDTYTFKKENVSCKKNDSGDINCRANGTITDLAKGIYPYSSKWERCLNTKKFYDPESFGSFACSAAKELGVYQKIKPRKIEFTFDETRWSRYKTSNPNANVEDFNFSEESLLAAQKIKREREERKEKRKRELAERKKKERRENEEYRRNAIRSYGMTTGIGVILRLDEKTGIPFVYSLDKRFPAYNKGKGLKLKDYITAINGQLTKGLPLYEVKGLIDSSPNSIVQLTIQREDPGRGLTENLTKSIPTITFMVDKKDPNAFNWF